MIDIEKAITAMASESVDCILIGGVALAIHSAAYVTYDIDFCYERSLPNLERVARALLPFEPRLRGFPIDLTFIGMRRHFRMAQFSRSTPQLVK